MCFSPIENDRRARSRRFLSGAMPTWRRDRSSKTGRRVSTRSLALLRSAVSGRPILTLTLAVSCDCISGPISWHVCLLCQRCSSPALHACPSRFHVQEAHSEPAGAAPARRVQVQHRVRPHSRTLHAARCGDGSISEGCRWRPDPGHAAAPEHR
jgi:hypothetical protein